MCNVLEAREGNFTQSLQKLIFQYLYLHANKLFFHDVCKLIVHKHTDYIYMGFDANTDSKQIYFYKHTI